MKTISNMILESIHESDNEILTEAKKDYSNSVPANVIKNIDKMLEQGGAGSRWKISDVYDDLSIFDWWPEYLTPSHLKKMRSFLSQAIKLGFDKYCCFKVGASGCANGMWASDAATTDGYSPKDCKTLYHSFTPDYNYWDVDLGNDFTHQDFKTIGEVKRYIEEETKGKEEMETTTPDEVVTGKEAVDKSDVEINLEEKSIKEACDYLKELTGLVFNTTRLNSRQYKLFNSEDNYVVVTLNNGKISNISDINIKK